jgi:hypothetical protein
MRGPRKQLCCAIALLLFVGTAASAWQWPVPVVEVTATFGQDAGGYLLRGIELGGAAQPVYPIESGIVVAARSDRSGVPSGLGSYVVIEHEQAFRSIYAHLDASILPTVGQEVTVDTEIGTVGETGQVRGRALRLYIIDLERGDYVNPVLLLPDLPDNVPPRIDALYARSSGALYDLSRTRSVPPGTYEITGRITDRRASDGRAVAPYAVRMFVGGQEAFYAVMDRIVVDPGESRVEPGGLGASVLYAVDGLMRLGTATINAGRVDLEVVALDFAGNEASLTFELTGRVDEDL